MIPMAYGYKNTSGKPQIKNDKNGIVTVSHTEFL